MATLINYPINFAYGAQDGLYYGPNGKVGKYHRGNDRAAPNGTPITIGPYTIGWVGATGLAFGDHCHTQACTAGRQWADDLNPGMYEFKYGTVVQAGWHNQFGNYVMIRVGGVDITYAHLSRINVSANQVLAAPQAPANQGDNEVADRNQANVLYQAILMRNGDEGGLNNYTGRNANQIASEMLNSQERKNLEAQINGTRDHANNLQNVVNQLQNALNEVNGKLASNEASNADKQASLDKNLAELQKATIALQNEQAKNVLLEKNVKIAQAQAIKTNQPTLTKTDKAKVSSFLKLLAKLFPTKK